MLRGHDLTLLMLAADLDAASTAEKIFGRFRDEMVRDEMVRHPCGGLARKMSKPTSASIDRPTIMEKIPTAPAF